MGGRQVVVGIVVLWVPRVLGPAYAASLPLLGWLLPGVMLFGGASALSAYFTNHAGLPHVPAQVAALSLALVPLFGRQVRRWPWRLAQHAGLTWRDLLRIRFGAGGF